MRASHLRIALWRGFMESDTGDDLAVVNFIHYKDEPDRIEGVGPDETSEKVMARYTLPDRLAFCHGAG